MANTPIAYIGIILMCTTVLTVGAQNIAPNPSFEEHSSCPTGYGNGGPLQCAPWASATAGTSDYFHQCASPANVGIPANFFGSQAAHTGDAYVGGYFRYQTVVLREYLLAPLTEPLEAGETYITSFWVSLADNTCGTSEIGAYFSVNPPPPGGSGPLNVIPQVRNNQGFITDKINWTLITGCFVADGGEQWITIGNFSSEANTPIDPECDLTLTSYYYIDDISVEMTDPVEPIDLDLGEPIEACYTFEIDPGIPDVSYLWEDGSTEETLEVTQSGTYSLTVTSGCEVGIDSLEVIINNNVLEDLDIGPDEIEICDGESFDIYLDPDLGAYEWQDGSDDTERTISTPGMYSVTLDDGCNQVSDEILVSVIENPAPFDLGEDQFLCDGEEIEFDFDPELGEFLWQDNSSSPSYLITDPGWYTLTISNDCGEHSDEILITALSEPEINLGPDQLILCEGDIYEIELDEQEGENSFLWQDGSNANIYEITEPGHYTVTVTNSCGSNIDDINVTFESIPFTELGSDTIVCPAQLPFILDAGYIDGAEYLWQDGSSSSTIEIATSGLYKVTISTSCAAVSDAIFIDVQDATPVINLPVDQMLCAGDTLMLDISNVQGIYKWSDLSTQGTMMVAGPGVYSVTVTNECGSASDEIVIGYIDPLLPPSLGPDMTLCPGETYMFQPGIAGVSYLWHDMSTADTLMATAAGMYCLQITDGCTTASDTVYVTIDDNPPVVDLPASVNLCRNETLTLHSGISGVEYLWNDGTFDSSLEIAVPGAYSITVSNACGTDVDTTLVIDAGPSPTVNLGQDIAICPGEVLTITPVSSDVVSWLWQDASTNAFFDVSGAGLITVEASNACGTVSDDLLVTMLPAIPILDLGADQSICPGEELTLSIFLDDVNIEWPDGSTGQQYVVSQTETVHAIISNQCGTSEDSIEVTLLPAPPVVDLGIDQSLCPGETITLSPGIPDVDYLWQDGSNSTSFSATIPGIVILVVSNVCGSQSDTLNIIENTEGPQVNLGQDLVGCEGDAFTLASDISGVDYLWQDGSTGSELTVTSSGIYYLQVTNNCGVDIDSVEVDLHSAFPDPFLGNDTVMCEGNLLSLLSFADSETQITWQDGSSATQLIVSSPGLYILSEANHCGSASDSIVVTYESAPPAFDLGPDQIICPGESIVLNAPATTALISWQDGSSASSIIANLEKTYTLQLSNNCGSAKDDIEISIDDKIPVVTIDPVISWCPGDVVTLNATQPFEADYTWSNGSTLPSIEVPEPGLFSIDVSTPCFVVSHDIEVAESNDCKKDLYIPNVFTPNNDGVNDEWFVFAGDDLNMVSVNCRVYDRWGNIVFTSQSFPISWNGTTGQQFLNPGIYMYTLTVDSLVGTRQKSRIYTGDITLIR